MIDQTPNKKAASPNRLLYGSKYSSSLARLTVTVNDFYEWHCLHSENKEIYNKIDKKQYVTFISSFFRQISEKIIKENFIFVAPYKLGSFYCRKIKRDETKKAINFHASKLAGKTVYHSNKHSFSYKYSIVWDKYISTFRNKGIMMFKVAAKVKRMLYDEIHSRTPANKKSYNSH